MGIFHCKKRNLLVDTKFVKKAFNNLEAFFINRFLLLLRKEKDEKYNNLRSFSTF
jgi:hypothetical protein